LFHLVFTKGVIQMLSISLTENLTQVHPFSSHIPVINHCFAWNNHS